MKNWALVPKQRGKDGGEQQLLSTGAPELFLHTAKSKTSQLAAPKYTSEAKSRRTHPRIYTIEAKPHWHKDANSLEQTQNHNDRRFWFPSPFLLIRVPQLALFAFCEYSVGGRHRELLSQRRPCELHIISRKKLLEAEKKHGSVGVPLDSWFRMAKSAKWKNLEEVRQTYSRADGVSVGEKVYTVFNISGNSFRLITEIYYDDQVILVRHVLTHAEYDKGNWKK
jgi:mRNA interferase HigB